MSRWLLQISFGPVQSFIASARRSRDLWAGSYILSEVARAAAVSLIDAGATLIYPTRTAVLAHGRMPSRSVHAQSAKSATGIPAAASHAASVGGDGSDDPKAIDGSSNLSNTLLVVVEVETAEAVRVIAERAQAAGRAALKCISKQELMQWKQVLADPNGLREALWHSQIDTAIDSYAAWSRCASASEYPQAYAALKRAFVARKNTRDFRPHSDGRLEDGSVDLGIPKSSLDGVNESVLPEKAKRGRAPQVMGLSEGEQLDALGCIKRSLGRQERFTALSRLAADTWIEQAAQKQITPEQIAKTQTERSVLTPARLGRLNTAYEELAKVGLATRSRGNCGHYMSFPYDAGLLFGGALKLAQREAEHDRSASECLKQLANVLAEIETRPNPYVALLVADGDGMGQFLGRATCQDEHVGITEAITKFADQVPAIAREHRGHAIYAGGDDLLVAFPLAGVVKAARNLAMKFQGAIEPIHQRLLANDPDRAVRMPSLRVGVAICHVHEPMAFIRRCADAAEKFAKGKVAACQGNALGLRLHIRSGHMISARFRFDDEAAFGAFDQWQQQYREGHVPGRLAYDIRAIAADIERLLSGQPAPETQEQADAIAANAFERVLERARARGGEQKLSDDLRRDLRVRRDVLRAAMSETLPDSRPCDGLAASYRALGEELILARWLSATSSKELGERGGSR